jgi:hypothetical protein
VFQGLKENGCLLLLNLIPVPTGAPCFINLILFFTGVDEAALSFSFILPLNKGLAEMPTEPEL